MELHERVREAVTFIMNEQLPEGSLKTQAEAMFSQEVSAESLVKIGLTADKLGRTIFDSCLDQGSSLETASLQSSVAVFLAGLAVGKRLGVQDAEAFREIVGDSGGV